MTDLATMGRRLGQMAASLNPSAWFEGFGWIQVKGGADVGPPDLRANVLQRRISRAVEWCRKVGRPIRFVILKPRQKGCSTFTTAVLYWLSWLFKGRGAIVGGSHEQGSNLFKMLKLFAERDDGRPTRARILTKKGTWPNGSTCVQLTASNPKLGRSFTFERLICTEGAWWNEEGVAAADEVLSALLMSVPNLPDTLVILESTANGASGVFYERYFAAKTFDEAVATHVDGADDFIRIFAAWWEFEECVRHPLLEGIESEEDYEPEEEEYAKRFNLTLAQVAWWRWAVRVECKGDRKKFLQEYPFDERSAFLLTGRLRFDASAIERIEANVRKHPPILGTLDTIGDDGRGGFESVVFRRVPSDEEATVARWEEPRDGMAYIIPVDVMTGATQTGGKDPDNHAVPVLRAGYFDQRHGWIPPAIVATLIDGWPKDPADYALIWDIGILEERLWRLAAYYGNCLIVPEENMDRGLIELLKLRGANIYRQKFWNRRTNEETERYGFKTTPALREAAIESLAVAIREWKQMGMEQRRGGIDIWDALTIHELKNMIVKDSGRSEAGPKAHDDRVLALAIGMLTIGGATRYTKTYRAAPLPPDLRGLEASRARNRSFGGFR